MVSAQTQRDDAPPATREQRFPGVYPRRLLRWRRPVWWQELAIIAIGYWLYSMGRNAVPEQASIALRHGRSVQHLQDLLHLNFELSVNQFVARNEWIAQTMDYYYATLHFIITIGTLVWLFWKRPQVYRGVRTVLFATTLSGLVVFYLYPLAPPRLLPQYGYIDTLIKFHTWGSLADPDVEKHSNPFAAMPSLHIAWAMWCAFALVFCVQRTWVRLLAAIYPIGTLLVIVGTANHFVVDAFGGAAVLGVGFLVQYLMSGHGAFVAPPDAPERNPRRSPAPVVESG